MAVQDLTYRLVKGTPLTPTEGDNNLRYLKNAVDALSQLFGVALNPDGTVKNSAVSTASLADRSVTVNKLAFLSAFYYVDSGVANALVATNPGGLTLSAYAQGIVIWVLVKFGNTGAATIDIDGLGAKSIVKNGNQILDAGDLPGNGVVALAYDGTQFQLVGALNSRLIPTVKFADLTYQTPNNVGPAGMIAGPAWNPVPLSTIVANIPSASVAGGVVVLPTGYYDVSAAVPFYQGESRLRVRDITSAGILIEGPNTQTGTGGNAAGSVATVRGRIYVSGVPTSQLSLDMWQATPMIYSQAMNTGSPEIYARISFRSVQ